jgi:hypothetical protein
MEDMFENTNILMSYGIANNISFEMDLIKKFNIKVYAFDCGIKTIKNNKLNFYPECIANDKFIYNNQKSKKISSYKEQIKRFNIENEKIYIKIDIEGAEYDVFNEDFNFNNIQGITIEIHCLNNYLKSTKLLNLFNKYFVLNHIHGNNYGKLFKFRKKLFPTTIELTYVNKIYVKSKKISTENYPTLVDAKNCKNKNDFKLNYWKSLKKCKFFY